MNVFSFSRLSMYEKCPRRFYFKYILEWPEPAAKPLALGKAVHRGIEMLMRGADKEEAVIEALIACDFHPEVTRNEVEELMHQAPKIEGKAEAHFELSLASGSRMKLQGYIDLLCDGEFFDWKTNRLVYEPADTMQIPLYAWAVMNMERRDMVKGTLYFLRYRQALPRLFTIEEAEKARAWAYQLAQEIAEKTEICGVFPEMAGQLFPPQPGSHCRFCPFAVECVKIAFRQ